MDYFKILHFNCEPFSNSPDPGFFYKSARHFGCIQKLEVALRLRRGLNVVLGDVGAGKTTLSRRLIGTFVEDETVEAHLIFDPYFNAPIDFLTTVARLFKCLPDQQNTTNWDIKESIKHFLFRKGVDENKTEVLIIDEGQKIPLFCLEILREFLNYETNSSKLLQIVIFAQTEFEETLKSIHNFSDRINLLLRLEPLSFRETCEMIRFRLDKASERGRTGIKFTYPAMRAVYLGTGGYPRKIVNLCHRVVLSLILQNRTVVNRSLVRACVRRDESAARKPMRWSFAAAFALVFTFWALFEYGVISTEGLFSTDTTNRGPAVAHVEKYTVPTLRTEKAAAEDATPDPPAVEDATPDPPAVEDATPDPPSVETRSVNAPEPPPPPPQILGRIQVRRKDMLSAMVARIYGDYSSEKIRLVAAANPHVKNIDVLSLGQLIAFPSLSTQEDATGLEGFIVKVATVGSLEKAFRFIQSAPKAETPLRVLACWNKNGTMTYNVVISKGYENEVSALEAVKGLPPELSTEAETLAGLPPGVVILNQWPQNQD
jgi:general secretion pathway protein A